MRIAVVTDTNSGMTREEAKQLSVGVVAMPVIIDGEVCYEGKNLTQERFYEALTGGRDVTTSQPSPGEVMDVWDAVLNEGYDEIVYIPMSGGLSESCNTAKNLAEEYDGKVQVVDNRRISVTHYASVLDALKLVEKGYSAAEIRKRLEEEAYEATIYVAVDTLDYLKKGGRITPAAAALGSVFNIKPVLSIQGGKLDAFAKVRGIKKAQAKMIEAIQKDLDTRFDGKIEDLRLMIAGSYTDDTLRETWMEAVSAAFPGVEILNHPLPLSIGCHVGPGAIGIGLCRRIH